VHYFFVDRANRTSRELPRGMGAMIEKYEAEADGAGVRIVPRVFGFDEARGLVAQIDDELAALFEEVNVAYATIHSDIFRLAALYAYGGIYHDAKCWSVFRSVVEITTRVAGCGARGCVTWWRLSPTATSCSKSATATTAFAGSERRTWPRRGRGCTSSAPP